MNRYVKRCSTLLGVREMKIKTTMRYHLTPAKIAIINQKCNTCWRGLWRKGNPYSLLVGMQTGTATMENNMAVPQKIKNIVPIWPKNLSPGYLPEKLKNMYLQRYMHHYVHCSIIHGGQGRETSKLSFDRVLDKEDVVCMYNGILLSHKKDETLLFETT